MPNNKPLTDRQSTVHSALQRATMTDKRLTRQQGKMLASDFEEAHKRLTTSYRQIEMLEKHIKGLQIDLEVEREFCTGRIEELNSMYHVLSDLLHVRVFSHKTDLWDVADKTTGAILLSGFATVPEAFEALLKLRLAKEKEEKQA